MSKPFLETADGEVHVLTDAVGHPTRAYKSTLTALHHLLTDLNRLQDAGKLADDNKLTTSIIGAMTAMKLGSLHFPDFAKNDWKQK